MSIKSIEKEAGKTNFIIGNGHSGTTILYKMLAYHPDLAWFCQYSLRQGTMIPGRITLPFSSIVKRGLSRVFKHDWRKGRDNPLIPRPSEMNSLWKYLWGISNLRERKKKIKEIIDSELRSWNRTSILIKNPWLGKYAALLHDALGGNCHFIHIVRDGRAVVQSILHKHRRYYQGRNALLRATRYWIDFLSDIIEFIHTVGGRNILEIRYEDLVESIPETLTCIMSFCGLDNSRFPYERLPEKLSCTNPRWINQRHKENILLIEGEAQELLDRYGYKSCL